MLLARDTHVVTVLLAAALGCPAASAIAGTIIYNTGNADTAAVALGVGDAGGLITEPNITSNASGTGLAYRFPDGSWHDATAPGCFCEGWGVSVNGTISGWANADVGGTSNLEVDPPSNVGASTVTTRASLSSLAGLSVTHEFQPASNAPGQLFRAHVTIDNATGSDVNDVKYVRVMDWDVPPTEFDEFVTIQGTATTTFLEKSHDNGFNSSDPLLDAGGLLGSTEDTDFIDRGPADHGAYFRFNFGTIAAGGSYSFDIFYGAAASQADAFAALVAESIELYSFGQCNPPGNPACGGAVNGEPATFIFGFAGVGGTPVTPAAEPALPALLSAVLLGLCAVRRLRRITPVAAA